MIDYRESKVSNRTLKQALLNRLRVWFERDLVMMPYGDHETRSMVNTLLEELETHAWKEGLIVDLGKHNDCVMALAHAIDQFTLKHPDYPIVMKSANKGEWTGGSKRITRNPKGLAGKAISRRR